MYGVCEFLIFFGKKISILFSRVNILSKIYTIQDFFQQFPSLLIIEVVEIISESKYYYYLRKLGFEILEGKWMMKKK